VVDTFGWNRREWLRIALLVALAVGFWCYVTGRTHEAAWQVPLEYGLKGADGDAQAVYSHIKAASEGEFYPFLVKNITRVGAPFYGNWSDFPIIEEWQFYLPGVLARWIGLFAAANVSVLVAQVLACVCFYITARLMDCKWWWAFAGGIAFGFAQFASARSIHHLMVTHYWYIPFCLLIADRVTRNEMGGLRQRRYLVSLLAAFLIGMQNPYYTNMFLQLVMLGAFYQYFRQGWRPVQQAAGIVAAAACGFFLMNVDSWIYRLGHGANPGAVLREYRWLELSALKFVDLLVPPQDHSLLGWIGSAYYGLAGREYDPAVAKMVAFPGEVPPSCYLGLLGIACLVWLAVVSVRRLVAKTGRPLPLAAWQVLWILAYAAVGGLNCLAGLLGATLFRSSTRYCIFILPILLLFAIKRLSRKPMDPKVSMLIASLCALLALWDQTPQVAQAKANLAELSRVVESDRQFTMEIEANLPKGAMVFQLPIMDYPESPAPGVSSSEHFRPYLHSRDLRFSFGAMKGRPWLAWQQELGKMAFPDAVHRMESLGFAAVYVNRNGFQDRGVSILNSFKQLGYSQIIESKAGDLFCVLIHPAAHPILPAGVAP
jgi:phosphoglycerol transferase